MVDPKAYQWDFDGACKPLEENPWNTTFSVGCFQWIPKASGRGLKRGKVAKRFRGSTSYPERVYDQARRWCAQKNAEEADVRHG